MKLFSRLTLSPVAMFRLVRWIAGVFFIVIGIMFKDAWAAYLFGALFIITSFFKPIGCAGAGCSVNQTHRDRSNGSI